MRTALAFFMLGSALIYFLGSRYFSFDGSDAAQCVLAANIGIFIGMFLVLWLETKPWVKKNILSSISRTWVVFLTVSFGIALQIAPQLRGLKELAILMVPAMLSAGLGIVFFGPIRDYWVRSASRTAKRRS